MPEKTELYVEGQIKKMRRQPRGASGPWRLTFNSHYYWFGSEEGAKTGLKLHQHGDSVAKGTGSPTQNL